MLFLGSLLLFYSDFASADPAGVIAELRAVEAREDQILSFPSRKSRFQIHEDPKTCSVLLIHGLYQSPRDQMELFNRFFAAGCNVFAPRLKGHWEKESKAFERIRSGDWSQQIYDSALKAREFGSQLTLVGHSTGALLAFQFGLEHPDLVSNLILLAPAFDIPQSTKLGIQLGSWLKLDSRIWTADSSQDPNSEYNRQARPAIAGKILLDLIRDVFGEDQHSRFVSYSKYEIPTYLAYSNDDSSISLYEVERFLKFSRAQKTVRVYPTGSMVFHDNIQRSLIDLEPGDPMEWKNPFFEDQWQEISKFLKLEID